MYYFPCEAWWSSISILPVWKQELQYSHIGVTIYNDMDIQNNSVKNLMDSFLS